MKPTILIAGATGATGSAATKFLTQYVLLESILQGKPSKALPTLPTS